MVNVFVKLHILAMDVSIVIYVDQIVEDTVKSMDVVIMIKTNACVSKDGRVLTVCSNHLLLLTARVDELSRCRRHRRRRRCCQFQKRKELCVESSERPVLVLVLLTTVPVRSQSSTVVRICVIATV
jgi:hypothetical protein